MSLLQEIRDKILQALNGELAPLSNSVKRVESDFMKKIREERLANKLMYANWDANQLLHRAEVYRKLVVEHRVASDYYDDKLVGIIEECQTRRLSVKRLEETVAWLRRRGMIASVYLND